MSRAGIARVGSGCSGERTTMYEGPTDAQDDAQGHAGSEDGGHGSDDGLNRVRYPCRFHDEPEEHVDHVDNPDGTVKVESVAEHEFP